MEVIGVIFLFKFLKETIGKKYEISVSKLLSSKNMIEKNNSEGYFCSEIVASVY